MEQQGIVPTLVVKRVIKAKRADVFAAWTQPEIMGKWFFCGIGRAEVKNDLRVGGSYQNNMIMQSSDDQHQSCPNETEPNTYPHFGEYLEILEPEKVVFTWNSEIVKNSRVTVLLRDLGTETEVTLIHELLETEDLRQKHNQGWDGCFANLEKYFAG